VELRREPYADIRGRPRSRVINHDVHPCLLAHVPQLDEVAPRRADGGLACLGIPWRSKAALNELREALRNAGQATQQAAVIQTALVDVRGSDVICVSIWKGGMRRMPCHDQWSPCQGLKW
jgi:hypothetical protein